MKLSTCQTTPIRNSTFARQTFRMPLIHSSRRSPQVTVCLCPTSSSTKRIFWRCLFHQDQNEVSFHHQYGENSFYALYVILQNCQVYTKWTCLLTWETMIYFHMEQKRKKVLNKSRNVNKFNFMFLSRQNLFGGRGDRECDGKRMRRGAQKCLGESPCRDDHQIRHRVDDAEWSLLCPSQDGGRVEPLLSQHPVWLHRPLIRTFPDVQKQSQHRL